MSNESVRREVQTLRDALEHAKERLEEQREKLQQLTSPPLAYATVIVVNNINATKVAFKTFEKIGQRVKIRPDSQFAGQNRNYGTVIGKEEKGWVQVEFDDGLYDIYRSGDPEVDGGNCDLEIVHDDGEASGTVTIAMEGKLFEVFLPADLKINSGDVVKVVGDSLQIVDVSQVQVGGNIAYVRRVVDEMFCEVDYESATRVVFSGQYKEGLEKGDRVILDASAAVIVRNLGKEDERFSFSAETNITWADIGGLEEAKEQMVEAVELPHTNPDIFKFYNKRPVKGVLLYGPPGCGKTMLGKATATALARIYNGGSSSAGFIYIKGPEILDKYVGVAEATIRQIFQRARKHKEEKGYPAVVFIDEADAILAKRGSGISSDVERTIVPMFLTEMDGLEDSGALVILATNRSDILDPAVVRDGRIDRKIKIDRPTPESTNEIFQLALSGVPLNNGFTAEQLAEIGSREVFSPNRVLYKIATKNDGDIDFTLGHVVNGGMIVSIVDQATSIALHRDLSNPKRNPQGLKKEDLLSAVDAIERQNLDLNHSDAIADFIHNFRDDVIGVHRLIQGKE